MEVPRYLHKPDGQTLRVDTLDACTLALADGWVVHPPLVWPEPAPVAVVLEASAARPALVAQPTPAAALALIDEVKAAAVRKPRPTKSKP